MAWVRKSLHVVIVVRWGLVSIYRWRHAGFCFEEFGKVVLVIPSAGGGDFLDIH